MEGRWADRLGSLMLPCTDLVRRISKRSQATARTSYDFGLPLLSLAVTCLSVLRCSPNARRAIGRYVMLLGSFWGTLETENCQRLRGCLISSFLWCVFLSISCYMFGLYSQRNSWNDMFCIGCIMWIPLLAKAIRHSTSPKVSFAHLSSNFRPDWSM